MNHPISVRIDRMYFEEEQRLRRQCLVSLLMESTTQFSILMTLQTLGQTLQTEQGEFRFFSGATPVALIVTILDV